MEMKNVKIPFTNVGPIIINKNNSKKLLDCIWIDDKEIINNDNTRIYIITVNDEIKKIGGSLCKGGIKNTMSFYFSANTGKPSLSRFSVMKEIEKELNKNNIVEIYVSFIEPIIVEINGLFGKKKVINRLSYKESEDFCKEEYYNIHQKYPDWNWQENNNRSGYENMYKETRGN